MRIYYFAPAGVKRGIRRPVYSVRLGLTLLFLLLAPEVFGQPQLLGAADMQAAPTRTPLGFTIHGRGFIEWDNDKREAKTTRWLTKHAAHLTDDYGILTWLLSDFWYLPTMADEAWERRKAAFIDCGGRWERAARSTSPRSIAIYVEAAPFTHPSWPNHRLGGLTDGQSIRATIAYINGMSSSSPWLVTFREVVEYEMGNLLAIRAGYNWQVTGREIGDTSPCSR